MSFEHQILSKFDSNQKTLFILEGLTQYVEKSALESTISTIDKICSISGSKLIISYVDSRIYNESKAHEIINKDFGERLLSDLKNLSEPWVTAFDVDFKESKYEMQDWLIKNTDGN